jgi:DNA (cytosine-5)-methyltransferase 1
MFAGYGGSSFALKNLHTLEFECIGYSEINSNAIKCYNMNHPNIRNFGDCTKINTKDLPDFDLLTGGFPCQDVSLAGKRDLSKGRTNLYKEILRIVQDKQPKYLLLENVAGLLSMGKARSLINVVIGDLKALGYFVFWKKLNSKDFGIPQSRDRVWIVAFRYDIYIPFKFQFPEKVDYKFKVEDLLEEDFDNKYFLSDKMIEGISKSNFRERQPISVKGNCRTLKVGGDTPCFHSLYRRSSKTNKGGTGHLSKQDGSNYCLDTGNNQALEIGTRIRKLTPKECFRLMGFLNDEIILDGLSDTAKYKLAGNGWDINLASLILRNMLQDEVNLN